MTRARRRIAALGLATALLAGCGTSAGVRYYTLEAPIAAKEGRARGSYGVAVGPITLPETVDRPHLVVRTGANRLAVVEEHRWAEPLKSEIPRVIAANLTAELGDAWVAATSQAASRDAAWRVSVDFQRFESAPEEAVTVEALWVLRRGAGNEAQRGRTLLREPAGAGGYDALVAAHGRALARLSREIAAAIRTAVTTPR